MYIIECQIKKGNNITHDWFQIWSSSDGADTAKYLKDCVTLEETTNKHCQTQRKYRMTYRCG